ncbi:uncharacterized protein B0I36DRAFT_312635 [Microdochium trichocladiopsis]|uniref:Uncharacterized protein n=1 Tax=Microdochium trichocladiopsis TaxID=1682393 RepID=A0A9P8YJC8_9PEZI|nr:uncharacterized protein B0I36DRAFT_312635 [Microdochium trichocladiopsis]KAH7041345.1 hypothetical protein B0I36DRAFT_312635 [Microdochium trichocladiopsis]
MNGAACCQPVQGMFPRPIHTSPGPCECRQPGPWILGSRRRRHNCRAYLGCYYNPTTHRTPARH